MSAVQHFKQDSLEQRSKIVRYIGRFNSVGKSCAPGDYLPLNPGEAFADVRVQFSGDLVHWETSLGPTLRL